MKLLIDESVNVRLRHHFPGHDARTVDYMGWKGFDNGDLLALTVQEFDVMITRDSHIPDQDNIAELDISVIVLYARSNSMRDLLPLVPEVLEYLQSIGPGQVIRIPQEQWQ